MTPARYAMPAGTVRTVEEIKRSRFITTLRPAATVEEARAAIAAISAEFAGATHNCWAYVVGPPGSTREIGMSDDGEPHGTAGRPMLTVLLHCGVGDIVAVVTRYFGGVLLGTGGLVKAYSGGVQNALDSLPTVERVPRVDVTVVLDYSAITPLKRLFPALEVDILAEQFETDFTFHLRLPQEHLASLTAAVIDLTSGQALIEATSQDG